MLFNSIEFVVFLPVVFALYWLLQRRSLRWQNALFLAASYLFYGWWDWRFLGLLFLSSAVDFALANVIDKTEDQKARKRWLIGSLVVNLGVLGLFKYFNFFIESAADALHAVGLQANLPSLRLILPIGISFYTFQSLSYTLDVYKRDLKPAKNLLDFLAFVSFFPHLVAGPIQRAKDLLPQFYVRRKFDPALAADGCRQMLWGFFKKVIVADNAAFQVNYVFANHASMDGAQLAAGLFLFAMQIYGDFSGYSDIAIGCSRLFGFYLTPNFAFPYFSRDIAEFWRRWHMSLSTWFRDFLYIPLGGNRGSIPRQIFNVMVTFVVSGFWHGANWTFIVWGFLNGLYYIPLLVTGRHRTNLDVVAQGRIFPRFGEAAGIAVTFLLTLLAWTFFRAENLHHAFQYLGGLASRGYGFDREFWIRFGAPLAFSVMMLVAEWFQREKAHALEVARVRPVYRWAAYYAAAVALLLLGNFSEEMFIYFQF